MYIKKKYYFCAAKAMHANQIRLQRYYIYLNCARKSVKKHQTYWVLFLALLLSSAMQAKVNNYVGAYANVGEWSLLPSDSKYSASFGVAGGLGCLYELQAGPAYKTTRFLLDLGVGVHSGMTMFSPNNNMTVELLNQRDLQGDEFDYIYELTNRHDQYNNLALQVPLMIGVQHKKFYMLAGVKVTSSLQTKAHTTANLNTYGRYADFDDFRNMPEYQFFSDWAVEKTADAKLNLNLDASVEIGGRLGLVTDASGFDVPKRKVECRLAAFLDYGVLDIHKAKTLPAINTPMVYDINPASPNYVYNTKTMVNNVEVNDIMSTNDFAKSVHNFMVGLKFTVLFQLPEPGQCVICRDAYRNSAVPRSGGLKYEE